MYPHLSFPQRILAKPWHAIHRKRGLGVLLTFEQELEEQDKSMELDRKSVV